MGKYIIGIDPDSKAHGVAVYENGDLIGLYCWQLMDIYTLIKQKQQSQFLFVIENVKANKGTFKKSFTKNKNAEKGVAHSVGMCKQAQIELERMLDYFNIEYKNFPISKMWKKNKKEFELVTKWNGRSNEDTRSAAYFGWLGVNSKLQ